MSLQVVLGQVDAGWFDDIDPTLVTQAVGTPLGRRLLARPLLRDDASDLLAPSPDGIGSIARRWPRVRLDALVRDLGALSFAPAIRSEVRREPVRRLRHALGNSYLLALDQRIWDGKVDAPVTARLLAVLDSALDADVQHNRALLAMFDAQGRDELWSSCQMGAASDRALGQWLTLGNPPAVRGLAHLPQRAVTMLATHHASRDLSAGSAGARA